MDDLSASELHKLVQRMSVDTPDAQALYTSFRAHMLAHRSMESGDTCVWGTACARKTVCEISSSDVASLQSCVQALPW